MVIFADDLATVTIAKGPKFKWQLMKLYVYTHKLHEAPKT